MSLEYDTADPIPIIVGPLEASRSSVLQSMSFIRWLGGLADLSSVDLVYDATKITVAVETMTAQQVTLRYSGAVIDANAAECIIPVAVRALSTIGEVGEPVLIKVRVRPDLGDGV